MRIDPHSYTDDRHAHVRSLAWEARVDFPTRTLHASATLHFDEPSSGALDLDTRALHVTRVTDERGGAVAFELHPAEDILGSRLSLSLPEGTRSVTIEYRTAPDASALQWLDPAQTAGGGTRTCSRSARRSTRARWCRSRTRPSGASPSPRRSRSRRRCGA